jgi:hypothetical protein
MSTDNQASRRKGKPKTKGAGPAESPTGQPMPSYESYQEVVMLIINGDIPAFEPGALAATLLLEMEREGHVLSDTAHAAIMRVAACLKKQHADEVTGDRLAREVIRRAKGG